MIRFNRHALALFLGAAFMSTAALGETPTISVYKSPTCTCCVKWITHLKQEGFAVDAVDTSDLGMVKSMAGIAPEQASCHTARVGDYVIEGHVPAQDIRRLLAEHPDARGLTAPGMPLSARHGRPEHAALPSAADRKRREYQRVRSALGGPRR